MDCVDKTSTDAGDDVSMDFEMDALLGFEELMLGPFQLELATAFADDEQLEDLHPACNK